MILASAIDVTAAYIQALKEEDTCQWLTARFLILQIIEKPFGMPYLALPDMDNFDIFMLSFKQKVYAMNSY